MQLPFQSLAACCAPGLLCLTIAFASCQPGLQSQTSPEAESFALAPVQTATLPADDANAEVEYALVTKKSIALWAKPQVGAQRLAVLRKGDSVEIMSGTQVSAGKVRVRIIQSDADDRPQYTSGWVSQSALGRQPDGSYMRTVRGGDLTPLHKVVEAKRPFALAGKRFSYGTGCSGTTYSEYSISAGFKAKTLDVTSTNALIHSHASPSGKRCSTVEIDMYTGAFLLGAPPSHSNPGTAYALTVEFNQITRTRQAYGESEAGTEDDCAAESEKADAITQMWPVRLAYCYQNGRTVPGLLAPPPGERNARPGFWAFAGET